MADIDNIRERQLAALDLGSNSFHLLVAVESGGRIQVVDKIREMVRLADGLDDNNVLNDDVTIRALDCLVGFSQRLRGIATEDIRIVGTNTLRKAKNGKHFLAEAERILGCKVDIISGREEARLIYLGVSHALEDNFDRRLVIDIGGGSTEIILGRQFQAELMESLHMGCVSMTRDCFGDGRIRASQFKAAIDQARLQLEPLEQRYKDGGWDTVIGASGTILAVQDILNELTPGTTDITREGLDEIRKLLIDTRQIERISLPGLPGERAPVFVGGLSVLIGLFESLNIERMQATSGALREGLIYDLLGRVQDRDVRESSIKDTAQRYHIDITHSRRVRESVIGLLAQTAKDWSLTSPIDKLLLNWAADLHEIGMDIAHSQYHKHGCYLLEHMDLPGFSRQDQHDLATLVRGHRRKFSADEELSERVARLTILLRIAVVLHRSRTNDALPHVQIQVDSHTIKLKFPKHWLTAHPLTRLDLKQEAQYLKSIGYLLSTGN